VPRVVAYPDVDSTIATASDRSPAIERVLGFDDDAGQISFVDTHGLPGRIDFRLGSVVTATHATLHALTSGDGSTIYGVDPNGEVVRLTSDGDWTFKPPRPAHAVFPLRDGSLLVLGGRRDGSVLWRMRPPETRLVDSVGLPEINSDVATQTSDRIYVLSSDAALIGIATRGLRRGPAIGLRHSAAALVATPSGDRVYVALDSSRDVVVVDRYRDRLTTRIEMPGQPRDLRIDPLGRYLLVRSGKADSVWIVAVGTDQLMGTVRSAWRSDLPFVAADGALALVQGRDVVFVDGQTHRERGRAHDGAQDFWFAFQWTGFRPRAATLDQPVDFGRADSTDTAARPAPPTDTGKRVAGAPPPAAGAVPATPATADTAARGFVVSFAALLAEPRARELASQIKVRGQTARVVATQREGATIYRVLLGPYPTRDEAERIGRESGQTYWVYQGAP